MKIGDEIRVRKRWGTITHFSVDTVTMRDRDGAHWFFPLYAIDEIRSANPTPTTPEGT